MGKKPNGRGDKTRITCYPVVKNVVAEHKEDTWIEKGKGSHRVVKRKNGKVKATITVYKNHGKDRYSKREEAMFTMLFKAAGLIAVLVLGWLMIGGM